MSDRETVQRGGDAYGIAPGGFRMPGELRLGRVRLQVAELERSLAYYQEVLGLRVIERTVSWIAWIAVNAVAVTLFAYKELWLTAALYLVFIALSVAGWRAWRARLPEAAQVSIFATTHASRTAAAGCRPTAPRRSSTMAWCSATVPTASTRLPERC